MLDRVQIKNMRHSVEANGYFVEKIKDEYIVVSYLMDPECKQYLVFPEERCPICGEYLIFDAEEERFICSGSECLYIDSLFVKPRELPIEDKENNKKYMEMKFRFNKDNQMTAEAFMEKIKNIVNEWYKDEIEIEFFDDDVMNQITLGYIDDDEE
jgi:hypothetical protein